MLKGERAQARCLVEVFAVDKSTSSGQRAEVEDAGGVEVQEREYRFGRLSRAGEKPKPLGSAGSVRTKGEDVSDRRPR